MIELVVVSYNNAPPARALSARFDVSAGTIGRSDDNHLVLSDPKHHVSRFQALVRSDAHLHTITNLSQANPTVLNGVELLLDQAQALRPGDEIRIGPYVLRTDAVHRERSLASRRQRIAPAPTALPLASFQPALSPAGPRAAKPAMHASAAAGPVPPGIANHQELLQAFLDGAGIPSITLSSGMTTELMTTLGTLLACAVNGTRDLVSLRALVKREVRTDVTMVEVRNNNPLKFLPDGATVLTQMLRKRMPGFMAPVEAMQDAFDDLHAHQLGMMAGMQASLGELHAQLDPAAVDSGSGPVSTFERLQPATRKARLWDSYRSLHEETGIALRNDTKTLGSQAFLSAYEQASEAYLDEAAGKR